MAKSSRSNPLDKYLLNLYTPSVEAKIWSIAAKGLQQSSPPTLYPEYTKPGGTHYIYRKADFWTSGFFPGSLYLLLERKKKHSHVLGQAGDLWAGNLDPLSLEYACKYWTESLHSNALLSNTHDLGFMIMPWAKVAYELNHDLRALDTIERAAQTLFSRYNSSMGCIRSWDNCVTKKYSFQDVNSEFMVIIDNMMNLDLLFYAASKTGNADMFSAAVQHARTTSRTHIRADGSTTHLVVLDPRSGDIRHRLTNQGHSHSSCWARGQAWAIAGFAETYHWTHDEDFLHISQRVANYFIEHLPDSGIVPWDFDAIEHETTSQPSDSSAAMVAAYGMLLIHEGLVHLGQSSNYLREALKLTRAVCAYQMNPEASWVVSEIVMDTVECGSVKKTAQEASVGIGDTILTGATINNYEYAPRRWANHGLVYADYYFLLVGNKMLEMGIDLCGILV
ncbi:hypothetical protein DPSP01_010400 [Paraphaeosphaeria sporulosa]